MLKKLAIISLLVLFLFNLFGYRLVFDAMQQHANKQLEAKLDASNYNQQELVILTIPLSMPYLVNSSGFERVDGQITLNGKIYHYVERKVSNGELVLRCLPDKEKMYIESAKNNVAKSSADAQSNTEKKSAASFKQVISDYDDALFQINIPGNTASSAKLSAFNISTLPAGVNAAPYHPPCI